MTDAERLRSLHKVRDHRVLTARQESLVLVAIEDYPTIFTTVAALMIGCPVCYRARGHSCLILGPGVHIHPERLRAAVSTEKPEEPS